jgi:hypothetical protein
VSRIKHEFDVSLAVPSISNLGKRSRESAACGATEPRVGIGANASFIPQAPARINSCRVICEPGARGASFSSSEGFEILPGVPRLAEPLALRKLSLSGRSSAVAHFA